MITQQFHTGQRVRLCSLIYTTSSGSIGTIVGLDQPFEGIHQIQFDGDNRTRRIYGIHLEALNTWKGFEG